MMEIRKLVGLNLQQVVNLHHAVSEVKRMLKVKPSEKGGMPYVIAQRARDSVGLYALAIDIDNSPIKTKAILLPDLLQIRTIGKGGVFTVTIVTKETRFETCFEGNPVDLAQQARKCTLDIGLAISSHIDVALGRRDFDEVDPLYIYPSV